MITRLLILVLLLNGCLFSLPFQVQEKQKQQTNQEKEELNLGKLYFPRPFIHKESDYKKGSYEVHLVWKKDKALPYFQVYDKDNRLLLEEMALVIPRKRAVGKFKFRVKKMLINGAEHFMIKVIRPDQYIYAFFLIKKEK